MKVNLPENISEITLNQFQRYMELVERDLDIMNFNKRKISIFTNIPFKELDNITAVDFERLNLLIDTALNTNVVFQPTFKINDIEFGFIPDFENITLGEFADLEKYGENYKTLHNSMAVLFRPIKEKANKRYSIESYKGTDKYSEIMKSAPLNIVNGAVVFFLNLANELENYILKYSKEE